LVSGARKNTASYKDQCVDNRRLFWKRRKSYECIL